MTARPAPRPTRPGRRRAPVAVALACALTLSAAATPPVPLVRQLWTADVLQQDGLALAGDAVYVARQTTLTAYDLATGAVRWSRGSPWDADQLVSMVVSDGMVRLAGPRVWGATPDGGQMVFPAEVTVLDAATGSLRWRRPGEVKQSTADAVLLGDRDPHGALRALRLVGARDGGLRWERPLTHVLDAQVGSSRIVTLTADGDVAVYRYADGAPVTSRRVESGGAGLNTVALVSGERLFVTRTDPRGATVTAYRLDDLTRLWRQRTLRAAYLVDCGPVLCLSRGAEVAGLDPATGEPRWLLPGRGGVSVAGPGRLLAYSNDEQPTQALVDAATGRVLGDGGAGWPMPAGAAADPGILFRVSAGDPTRTVVSRIDLASGRITTIGTVASIVGVRCDGSGHYLVCRRPDGIVVTALGDRAA
ncbi:outer membrane protein assembly factor BamB family protein [Actinoplanes siamensis]|uniref:outer membrane protein assembly factor BamB family protein n=1 Tax=Actinoplanes siamensis TaxID=1223317 RepID=UPI0019410EFC|nr:PQQ-binding-like beta-propeller repeat protein [Actinoplanes siamensis]